jgi:hypothetical protein
MNDFDEKAMNNNLVSGSWGHGGGDLLGQDKKRFL